MLIRQGGDQTIQTSIAQRLKNRRTFPEGDSARTGAFGINSGFPCHNPPSRCLQEQGNSNEQNIAEMRNKQGSDARKATEAEAQRQRPDKAIKADPIKAERVTSQAPDGRRADTSGDRASQQAEDMITITDPATNEVLGAMTVGVNAEAVF